MSPNTATFSVIYDGIRNFELEPRLSLVGAALDENFLSGDVMLPAYAKLDVLASYKFTTISACSGGSRTSTTRAIRKSIVMARPGAPLMPGFPIAGEMSVAGKRSRTVHGSPSPAAQGRMGGRRSC